MIKIGDKVKVYEKPLTEEGFEGEAIVKEIKFIDEIERLYYCLVKFNEDQNNMNFRTIKA
jgi:hypothetical protein